MLLFFNNNLNVNFMIVKKKFGVKSAPNVLTDAQMKLVIAGYGAGYGYGSYGYYGTGAGSPCYSFTGRCHSRCGYIHLGVAVIGTCQDVGLHTCGCISDGLN